MTSVLNDLTFDRLRSGDSLEIPSGDYEVAACPIGLTDDISKAPLRLKGLADVSITGRGRVRIFSKTHGDILAIRDCHNLRFSNITFEGAGITGQPFDLFAMVNLVGPSSFLEFDHLRFLNFGNHGISQLNGPKVTKHVHVHHCHFINGGNSAHPELKDDGAAVSGGGSDLTVEDCTIVDCLRGIELQGAQPDSRFHRIAIRRNRIINVLGTGIMMFADPRPNFQDIAKDIAITENIVTGCVDPNNRSQYKSTGMLIQGGSVIQVCGNMLRGFQTCGISVDARNLAAIDRILIANNSASDCGWRVLQVLNANNAIIEGNHLAYGASNATVLLENNPTNYFALSNKVLSRPSIPAIQYIDS